MKKFKVFCEVLQCWKSNLPSYNIKTPLKCLSVLSCCTGEPAGLIACLTDSASSERWPCCSFHGWQAQAHTCRHTPQSQSMDRNRFWMPSNYHQWMALWDRQALPCACLRLITHIFHFSPTSTLDFHSPPLLKCAILFAFIPLYKMYKIYLIAQFF